MVYKILALADVHWGAMDPNEMYQNLELVLEFIREKKDLDLVVICGDYFDYRLTLNSKAALKSIKWFDELYECCKEAGVKKLRVVKGTKEHDNDQLEALRPKDSGDSADDFFRKLYTCTVEETLPGMKCIYCPDEPINIDEYTELYQAQMLSGPDIGFFHGNFDELLPQMVIEQNKEANIPSIIYFKDHWASLINGPMIAGHWHIFQDLEPLIYVGSFDRWKFGETEDKGFLFVEYDTDKHSYFWKRILNPLARQYEQITVDNSLCNTPEDFAELKAEVEMLVQKFPTAKLKVRFQISVDDPESVANFDEFRNVVSSMKNVKCDVKDLVKRAKKKQEREITVQDTERYQYIFNNPLDIRRNIQEYLKRERNLDVSLETIDSLIGKYLNSESS